MKTVSLALMFLNVGFAAGAQTARFELPQFGALPDVSRNWRLAAQGTNGTASAGQSWLVLTNSAAGDILSFAAAKKNVFKKALEYSIVFEEKSGPNRLAHGYALALGEWRVFVQHTSIGAITPDLAQGIASGLIGIHSATKAVEPAPTECK